MLVGQHRAGAGFAADADEAALVQRVVGQLQHADVAPDLGAGHLRQRVELAEGVVRGGEGGIDLQHRHLAARAGALVAALAGGPGAHAGQFAAQRFDLADAAAFAVAILVEAEQALLAHQRFQAGVVRAENLDGQRIVFAHLFDEPVGLRMQAPGVQAEHPDVPVQLPGHVHQHHILRAAEGQPQVVTEVLEGELEDVLG